MAGSYFRQGTFDFLKDLAANNERGWFEESKERYKRHVREPAFQFIVDFQPHLKRISPRFRSDPRPVGGSLFRIHRDVRFAKDKSPYKTHVGIQFRHERGKDAHAPGFYLHIEPGGCFAGLGCWRPAGPALKKIRRAIVETPGAWKKAVGGKAFRERWELEGDRLKRAPRGFDPEHPLVEDLKRKDFIAVASVPQSFVTGKDLPTELATLYRSGTPLVRFLCEALEVEF